MKIKWHVLCGVREMCRVVCGWSGSGKDAVREVVGEEAEEALGIVMLSVDGGDLVEEK